MKTIQLLIIFSIISISTYAQDCEAWFYPYQNGDDIFTINFQDGSYPQSNIQTWEWNFGDGNTSSEQSPSYTYVSEGEYTVQLIIETATCSDTFIQVIRISTAPIISCNADFYYSITGNNNETVDFIDNSYFPGAEKQWFWDFGDGNTSSEQNPSHTYSTDSIYTVSLEITYGDCSDTAIYSVATGIYYIGEECISAFSFEEISPSGNTFQFYDGSYTPGDSIQTYFWDFGDGNTDTIANPVHSYTENGEYVVTLDITTQNCESYSSNYITTGDSTWYPENCQALYWFTTDSENYKQYQFYDYSYGNDQILAWYWNFGDGNISTQPNPVHEYETEGTYLTSLTIFTEFCESTFPIEITVLEDSSSGDSLMPLFYPEARFTQVTFHNLTRGDADSWDWNFGDGVTSSMQSPIHNFDEPGIHEVSLAARSGNEVNTIIIQFDIAQSKGINTINYAYFYPGAYNSVKLLETFNFSIYPNPANNILNVKTSEKNLIVSIYNITGQCVIKQKTNTDKINIENLTPGLYIIKIENEKLSGTVKFTKF